jgi:diguanylate cyclase (GGDEF)-like protein
MRLSAKLLLFVIPAISASLLILGVVAYWQLKQSTEERLLANLENSATQADMLLASKIKQVVKDSSLIANTQLLKKYVTVADEDQRLLLFYPVLMRALADIQKILPDYYEIRVIFPDGYEEVRRVVGDIPNKTEEEQTSDLFRLIRSNKNTSAHVLLNADTGAYTLYVAHPLIHRDPNFEPINAKPRLRAFLVISVGLEDLQKTIDENLPGNNGHSVVFLPDGTVVFSSDDEVPGLPVDFLSGQKQFVETGDHIFYRASSNQLVNIVSILHVHELAEATNRLAIVIALITCLTLLGLSALLYTLMRIMVINPIKQLMDMSKQIGYGNLQVFYQYNKTDEFGDLGASFEQMATSLRESDEQIKTLAYRDALTGTPNRAMFHQYLKRVTDRAARNDEQYALLFIDIDDFKIINDTKGHAVGDLLLQEISTRINKQIRNSDFIAVDITGSKLLNDAANLLSRLGGDEFTILLPDLKDPLAAGTVAGRLIDMFSAPILVRGEKLHVGISIGITVYPVDSRDTDELLRFADMAMYHAKERGKNNYQFYQETLNETIHKKMNIATRLREAIGNKSLYLEYQPQVELKTNRIVGVEALLRWQDSELGRVRPDEFIPIAESSGEILAIGEWVIHEACRQQAEWIKQGFNTITMSVNVSSVQFERQDVSLVVSRALARYKLDPGLFEVEITESTTMNDPEHSIIKLNKVRSEGVSIALDDFGTGFSSLSHLLKFPIDVLKVDRNFVINIITNRNSMSLISTIVAMAHNLGMKVIAEGVEDQDQVDLLQSIHCDVIQGYVFSRPLAAADIPAILNQFNGSPAKVLDASESDPRKLITG